MPAVIGRRGIVKPWPIELNGTEQKELEKCAKGLREVISGANKEIQGDKELKGTLEKELVAEEK
jgi:L-lactate dehydrogenase